MAKRRVVGSYTWHTGPLVIGSAATRKLVQDKRDAAARKRLQGVRGQAQVLGVGVELVVAFRGQLPSTWIALGPRAGVLVRVAGHTNHADEVLAIDPWSVPDAAWKPFLKLVKLSGAGPRVLFDAIARMDTPIVGDDRTTIPVKLPPGDYTVDKALAGKRAFKVTMFRIRPMTLVPTKPKRHKPARPPGPPDDLVLRDETIALAKHLRFLGTDGGPLLVLPKPLLKSWLGTYDASGAHVYDRAPCDYDRACDAKGVVISVGKGQALTLDREGCAYVPRPDGTALIVFWIGGDEASHVLEAVLSSPAKAWSATKETFTMTGTALAFIDANRDGRKEPPTFVGKLAPGRYTIERMKEFNGRVRAGTKLHDVMATALRLRPA